MQKFRFVGALAAAALMLSMAAAVQDGISLKRSPKVGDVAKYKLKVELNVQGQPFNLEGLVTEKVVKVEEGKYSIESSQGEMKLNGQDAPMESPASTSTYSATGRLLELKGEEESEEALRMSSLQAFEVPDKPVKVGDTWTISLKAKEGKNPVGIKGDFKVEAQEKVGEYDVLKVTYEVKETEGSAPASSKGTVWFNVKDATMVKYEGTWTGAPFPMVGPTDAKVTLERAG
jgi:hypothetical protein